MQRPTTRRPASWRQASRRRAAVNGDAVDCEAKLLVGEEMADVPVGEVLRQLFTVKH
jgi:hypothetical protein